MKTAVWPHLTRPVHRQSKKKCLRADSWCNHTPRTELNGGGGRITDWKDVSWSFNLLRLLFFMPKTLLQHGFTINKQIATRWQKQNVDNHAPFTDADSQETSGKFSEYLIRRVAFDFLQLLSKSNLHPCPQCECANKSMCPQHEQRSRVNTQSNTPTQAIGKNNTL